jgi:hypothetical protein
MSADLNEIIPKIMSVVDRADTKNKNRSEANLIIELAMLRLLIDAKITTAEAAIQQIHKTRHWLSVVFSDDHVDHSIERAIEFLRSRETDDKPQAPLLPRSNDPPA